MEKEISIDSDSPVDTTDSSIDKDHEVPGISYISLHKCK